MMKEKKEKIYLNPVVAIGAISPREVKVEPIKDPGILDEGRLFAEALNQTKPITNPGSRNAYQASASIKESTALQNGLKSTTTYQLVINGRQLKDLVSGANPTGKAAEIVAISDFRDLHFGKDPGIVNSPKYVAKNVEDIRLSPDHASRKDLVFQFKTKQDMLITKANGQVKTGSGQYIARKLVRMANTPGYGKIGYVDAKFVNQDGTPRIAPGAFTRSQAHKLLEAKVRLRGIPDIESRAVKLYENIIKNEMDGLKPVERRQLGQLRDDIAKAYRWKNTSFRVAGGAAAGATTAAIVSLILQIASNEATDLSTIGESALTGGLFGAGGSLADASLYHMATNYGMTPEAAKSLAQQGVAAAFCLVSITTDIISEAKSVSNGENTIASAVSGSTFKVAIDLLPIVLAPIGLLGIPILVSTQIGGRWGIAKLRESDKKIEYKVQNSIGKSAILKEEFDWCHELHQSAKADSDYTNKVFEKVMSLS